MKKDQTRECCSPLMFLLFSVALAIGLSVLVIASYQYPAHIQPSSGEDGRVSYPVPLQNSGAADTPADDPAAIFSI